MITHEQRMHNARQMAGWLTPKERRFILAASKRRAKSYATIKRHARGGNGRRLRRLFAEVTGRSKRSLFPAFVLSGLGAAIKDVLEGRE